MVTRHFDMPVEGAQNFIKALIRELKPYGICREGGFSFLDTDLDFTGKIISGETFDESEKGFTFEQFDYWESDVSYMEYESCTGSTINIYITLCGDVVGYFENIGSNTYRNFMEACKATFSPKEIPSIYIPVEATRPEDGEKISDTLWSDTSIYRWRDAHSHFNPQSFARYSLY